MTGDARTKKQLGRNNKGVLREFRKFRHAEALERNLKYYNLRMKMPAEEASRLPEYRPSREHLVFLGLAPAK
jgi:hypothetical protein